MPTPNDVLAHSLAASQQLLNRFCEDLTPADYLYRPCEGGNCAAWLLGHLVMSERGALGRAGVTELPPIPEGFDKTFARDVDAPKATTFGDTSILLPLFNRHRQLLIETVKALPAAALDKTLDKPHPMFSTVAQVLGFMALHMSMHAGQITMIRRSLGRPPVI